MNNSYSPNRGDDIPIYELSVRVLPDRGGPVNGTVSDKNNLAGSGSRHVLLLVHGFNNTASDADESYDTLIAYIMPRLKAMREGPDAIAKFQWPGDEAVVSKIEVLDAVGYPTDIQRALDSARALATWLTSVAPNTPGGNLKVSIVGHSLGCRLTLEMLNEVLADGASQLSFEVVNLMAAAVPVGFVDGNGSYDLLPGGRLPQTLIKAYSLWDLVLLICFPLGEALGVKKRTEDPSYFRGPTAVGRAGNPPVLGKDEDSIKTSHGHSAYWQDEKVADRFLDRLNKLPLSISTEGNEIPSRELPATGGPAGRALPTRT